MPCPWVFSAIVASENGESRVRVFRKDPVRACVGLAAMASQLLAMSLLRVATGVGGDGAGEVMPVDGEVVLRFLLCLDVLVRTGGNSMAKCGLAVMRMFLAVAAAGA